MIISKTQYLKFIEEATADLMNFYLFKGYVKFPPSQETNPKSKVITENFKNGEEFAKIFARKVEMLIDEIEKKYEIKQEAKREWKEPEYIPEEDV